MNSPWKIIQELEADNSRLKKEAIIRRESDADNDVFIPEKPYSKWILDETTWSWKAPVDMPDDGKNYVWNDNTGAWEEIAE